MAEHSRCRTTERLKQCRSPSRLPGWPQKKHGIKSSVSVCRKVWSTIGTESDSGFAVAPYTTTRPASGGMFPLLSQKQKLPAVNKIMAIASDRINNEGIRNLIMTISRVNSNYLLRVTYREIACLSEAFLSQATALPSGLRRIALDTHMQSVTEVWCSRVAIAPIIGLGRSEERHG